MSAAIFRDALFDHLSTAIVVADKELCLQDMNPAAESLFEQSLKQRQGKALSELIIDTDLSWSRLESLMDGGENFSSSEFQFSLIDGRQITADLKASAFVHESREFLLLELRQIDYQKRLSQENQQWAQQQAARELIRGLAHEIKNPLGGLRGAAQLLEKQLSSESLREFTSVIIDQSDRLRNLVDSLLGPNNPPRFAWENLHKVVEKIRLLVTLDDIQDIEIERDYDPSIPDIWIDHEKLQQAILNIARNSVQALNGKGRITFVTRIERQVTIHGKKHPLCAVIRIIDNGPGIPTALKDTVFYPMVTSKDKGSGLGLSIAQRLVDLHRGKIDVQSSPGHTEFSLYLPVDKKEP